MKKWGKMLLLAAIVLGGLLGLLLSSGREERTISGELTQVWGGPEAVTAFTLRTEGGKELGFTVLTNARVFGPVEDYREGNTVLVTYRRRDHTLALEKGIKTYKALDTSIEERLEQGAVTLKDGTSLDALSSIGGDRVCYKLPGGERLLYASCRATPEWSFVGGVESFEDLSPAAREKVRAYYEEQGCLYDLDRELERAWEAYREAGEKFQTRWVDQDVSPSASGRRVMYFLTTVHLPTENGEYQELQTCAVFDRETGEHLSPWDLFSCPREEAVRTFLDASGVEEGPRRREMEAALKPENILFFQDSMDFSFEQGALPGEEHAVTLGVAYDHLDGLLQPWALPEKGGET